MERPTNSISRRARNLWDALKSPPQWLEWLEGRIWSATDETRGFKACVKRYLQILDSSIRGFREHDSMTKASALTYTSILTLVPILAIVMSLLKAFAVFDRAQKAVTHVVDNMLAAAGAELPAQQAIDGIIERVFDIVNKTDFSKLGLTATIGLLLAAMSLMSRVEQVMNDVWSVHKSRPLTRKIADYINMLLVLTMMLIATSGAAGKTVITFSGLFAQLNALQEWLLRYIPYIVTWAAFIFLFHYMPNTRVRWRSAIISGLISGILFQLLQLGFFAMAAQTLNRYRTIYGSFGIVLFLLFWIWFSWSIVLWGVEFCNAHQNIRDWRRRRRTWSDTPAERETLGLRLAAVLAAPMLNVASTRAPMDTGELADELKLPSEPVGEMLDLFENNGLVKRTEEGAFVFVRSPEAVTMLDLLRLVRHGRLHGAHHPGHANEALSQSLRDKTIKDLASQPIDSIHTYAL
ncbi:YihY/virulence factor BrkB family protein [bacterium]|nr:YihY/virulence factor BrkB family protein [bacterium]